LSNERANYVGSFRCVDIAAQSFVGWASGPPG